MEIGTIAGHVQTISTRGGLHFDVHRDKGRRARVFIPAELREQALASFDRWAEVGGQLIRDHDGAVATVFASQIAVQLEMGDQPRGERPGLFGDEDEQPAVASPRAG